MSINIKATKIQLDDELRRALLAKIEPLYKFTKNYGSEVVIQVEIGRETNHHLRGPVFKAEIHLAFGKQTFYAGESAETLNSAIDLAKDEMTRQLRSFNKKHNTLVKRAGRLIKKMLRWELTVVKKGRP